VGSPVSDQGKGMEGMEALYKGAKGDKGEPGKTGSSRLAPRLAWALVILFVVAVAIGGTAWFSAGSAGRAANHAIQVSQAAQKKQEAAQRRQQAAQQAAQRRQGELIEAKLCQTFGALAALKPPAGSASANPSRAYEQDQHAILSQIGADLGCKGH
jgi:hypothetical protein